MIKSLEKYQMCRLIYECPDDVEGAGRHWGYWKGIAISGGCYGIPTISEMNVFREMQVSGELVLSPNDGKRYGTMHGGD